MKRALLPAVAFAVAATTTMAANAEVGVTDTGDVVLTWAPVVVAAPGADVVIEGDTGTVTMQIPVTLSAPAAQPVTLAWETLFLPGWAGLEGYAEPPGDYVAASGTVTFTPGDTSETVPVVVNGDTVPEPPLLWGEWLIVRFYDPSPNARIDQSFFGLGLGVILDDD